MTADARGDAMSISWSEDLALGVPSIDEQHKALFYRVDRLIEAVHEHKGRVEVERLLSFLEEYVEVHFATEERLQAETGYPEAAFHRILHERFAEELKTIRQSIEEEPGVSFILLVNNLVVSWLRHHIAGSDRAFAEYLRAQRGETSAANGGRPGRKRE